MALDPVQLVGLLAALCTTSSFVPQAIRAWRTRQTSDVSMWMLILLLVGVSLWLTYGLLIRDLPLIVANILTLLVTLCVFVAKLRFG
jgi:MtN3 and saliva related transmembrane protein